MPTEVVVGEEKRCKECGQVIPTDVDGEAVQVEEQTESKDEAVNVDEPDHEPAKDKRRPRKRYFKKKAPSDSNVERKAFTLAGLRALKITEPTEEPTTTVDNA